MANTTNRGYPKPVVSNFVSEDVLLLIQSLDMVDADVAAVIVSLAGKAAVVHAHEITDVSGLAAALAALAPLDHNHALANLSDVEGLALAPDGYVIRKVAGTWQAASAASLFASHSHVIGDITNLQAALDERLTAASLSGATAKGTPVDADTVPLSDSAASGAVKRLSWANLKATLKTYFDTLYSAVGHAHSAATTSAAGFMSAADKTKLDGVGTGQSNKRIYLSSTTWSKPAGLVKVVVTVMAAGGGGGGRPAGGSTGYRSGGGGAGGKAIRTILAADLAATVAVTVGTAAAGVAGNGAAGTGSSFGAHCAATGGGGGAGSSGAHGAGGAGGAGTAGDILFGGRAGSGGSTQAENYGGNSADGPGGDAAVTLGAAGMPGLAPGAGGGGVFANTSAALVGSVGGPGYVIVEEFFST